MTVVLLDTRARAVIEEEAVRKRLVETGGPLFGWQADDTIVIACAAGPGDKAKHRPHSFTPHRASTATAMRAVVEASDERYGYLGSWHTHPGGGAVPSATDAATAKDLAGQEPLLLPEPLLLILSTTRRIKNEVTVTKAWHWNAAEERLIEADLHCIELEHRHCPAGM